MKITIYILTLSVLSLLLLVAGLHIGSFEADWQTIYNALTHYDANQNVHFAIVQLRLPHLVLAFVAGGALALSGYLMQAMINNPLADPYILGTASGAALGANLVYAGLVPLTMLGVYMPPLFALFGAALTTGFTLLVSRNKGQFIPSQLLLAGIAISSLLNSVISLIAYLADSEGKLKSIVFWIMGGFERAEWSYLLFPSLVLAGMVILFMLLYKHLFLLYMGESRARYLGLQVNHFRLLVLLASSLLTASVVAVCGVIGFVGLIIPHVTRAVLGTSSAYNILLCAWTGGVFLLACDVAARAFYPPVGVPIGIITSFTGIPFFVYLLSEKKFKFS